MPVEPNPRPVADYRDARACARTIQLRQTHGNDPPDAGLQCHQCTWMHGRLRDPARNRQAYRGENTTFLIWSLQCQSHSQMSASWPFRNVRFYGSFGCCRWRSKSALFRRRLRGHADDGRLASLAHGQDGNAPWMPRSSEEAVYGRAQGPEEQAESPRHESPRVLPGAVSGRGAGEADAARRRNADRLPVSLAAAAQRAAVDRLQGVARRTGVEGSAAELARRGDWILPQAMAVPDSLRDDGRLPLDNNVIERDIRPFATARKSWLFSGTVAGAKASALRPSRWRALQRPRRGHRRSIPAIAMRQCSPVSCKWLSIRCTQFTAYGASAVQRVTN